MAKVKTGLSSISEGRTDVLKVNPANLHIKPDWNGRDLNDPANKDHINELALSIAEVGVRKPLVVYWENGKAYISDGHCRLIAVMQAIQNGAEIKTIPVISEERYANDADRIFSQVVHNSGKPFSQMEQAKIFKRLLDHGWQQGDIARKAGLSAGRVSQILSLLTLPEVVKAAVVAKQVSPSMAVQMVKDAGSGTEAEKALKAGLEAAKADGRDKVKPADLEQTGSRINLKSAVKDAFEYSDVDDSEDDVVVIKMPIEKWEIIRKLCEL